MVHTKAVFRQFCSVMVFLHILALSAVPSIAAGSGPFGIALSWSGDPATTITVVWRDDGARAELLQIVPQMEYVRTGFEGAAQFSAVCRDVSLDGSGVWHYEAVATGLEPATTYAYRVGGAEIWSEVHTFITDDPAGDSVAFAYLGDAQPDGDMETGYAAWGELCRAMFSRDPELSFAVLGGDIVNSGISVPYFDSFFRHASEVFSQIPLFSAVGNHESNFIGGKPRLFLDYFAFPENGPEGFKEEIFSMDVGNVHILVLNDWIFSGEQDLTDADFERVADWIRADLAVNMADWQIAVLHVPVYEVHSDTRATRVRADWASVFEDYGVDLVFEGHQHVYSRSYPMYRKRIDYENGITYIMGVSGSKFYDSSDETRAERVVYEIPNYELVRTDGSSLTVQALDARGNELDYVAIPQRGISVTRGEFIETLWKAAGSPASAGASPFADTEAEAVAWAYESGVVQGYGNGLFGPEDRIEDWQIGLILGRR